MTDSKSLLELAERVEALTRPCRRIDAAIARIFLLPCCEEPDCLPDVMAHNIARVEAGGDDEEIPAYTASLDAAMTLVPVLAFWRLGHDGEGADPGLFKAHILSWTDGTTRSQRNSIAIAATPALALTAAALRARAAQKEPGQ
jgi:hypothetical protein